MKFIYSDSLDGVDPTFNFLKESGSPERQPYWDDLLPHELLGYAPYDGVLVSKATVGDHRIKGSYTIGQARRFELVGARKFLRLDSPEFKNIEIFGDCGAFSYAKEDEPPFTPEEMAEFYAECKFTHGCSVDHIIFDFDDKLSGMSGGTAEAKRRFEITLENADIFLRANREIGSSVVPIGAIQGWSPDSMAEAARCLVVQGYKYLALGGMAPLNSSQIQKSIEAVRSKIPSWIKLHVLGFAKADEIQYFKGYGIESFDTTSPLLRSFKDATKNYYLPTGDGKLDYYTAIRIPQALENPRLKKFVKMGVFKAEDLVKLEADALSSLRQYDAGIRPLSSTLDPIIAYNAAFVDGELYNGGTLSPKMQDLKDKYIKTLSHRPWDRCSCKACTGAGVEVMMFRGNTRNKSRGFHNIGVYAQHLNDLELRPKAIPVTDTTPPAAAKERQQSFDFTPF